MRDEQGIHLPEFYLKFGSLKKYLRRLYNLKVTKQKVKIMKDPRITEEVKEQIEEKIISSFLSTEFVTSVFPYQEDADVEFQTTDEGDLILLTFGPVDTRLIDPNYEAYKSSANTWATQNGLMATAIMSAGTTLTNEIIFVFAIIDLDKLLGTEQPITQLDASDILNKIKDRANKIQKHSISTQMSISTNDAQELNRIYERLRIIEENCDNRITALQTQLGIKAPKKEQKFWVTLLDRNGKQKDRMEVSYKEEDYARSAFQAAGNTVHATDTIKFE